MASTCVVALTSLGIAGVAAFHAITSSQLNEVDDTLQRTHEAVEQTVQRGSGSDTDSLSSAVAQVAPGLFVAVLDEDGTVELSIPARVAGHESLTVDVRKLDIAAPNAGSRADVPAFTTRRADDTDVELRLRTSRIDDGKVLILGVSLEEIEESRQRLLGIELVVAAIALAISAGMGWVLVDAGLRPLRDVEATARRIADEGDLDHEVPGGDGPTEIGTLATALNTMLARIREAFAERDAKEIALHESEQRMRRFVADVSHELRTPLTAVSAYAELIDRGARERPADLARALAGIGSESARMRDLVEELLLLARLDEGRPMNMTAVDLSAVVVEAVGAARTMSADWPISLHVGDLVMVDGDASRLRQVIDNLLANVRTHTPAGTQTNIEVRSDGHWGVVVIRDSGTGMTAESAARVFERFFRADTSRSRTSGGSGLGLAIVHALVDAHRGRISVDTAPGEGMAITIELPLRRSETSRSETRRSETSRSEISRSETE
ncbi:MAG: HAMP domain-containing sensor histidine kinase [Ilumatobacteraceae bacterium]